ncbi:MAG: sporulation membrane protein YtaF [Candidatus Alkaliphilus sp. MAG34]|nr:sporulation membrane protein YtaF [Clostridiales bacterium]
MVETLLLVFTLSLDAFVASVAYGTNEIKIPFISTAIINITCSSLLAFSLFLGSVVKKIVPESITLLASFLILMLLGIFYLFQGIIKNRIAKTPTSNGEVKLKISDLIISVYVDETNADFNKSKDLGPKESLYLAVALSLDSLAIGFSSSLAGINYIRVIFLSLLYGIVAVQLGLLIGRKLVEKSNINISWLSGAILMVLAITKII